MKFKYLKTALFSIAALFSFGTASASYPEKPITIVCWSAAGSGHDLMARMIAKVGEKYLGQPIVVVNRRGGSGKVAMSYVRNAAQDGYTVMTNTRSMTTSLAGSENPSIEDFKYISRVVKDPFLVTVAIDSEFDTMDDLIAFAKANPNQVKIGGYSTKSVDEALVQDIESKAGIELNYIPYPGGKDPVVAILGGHIDVAVANPSEMLANYQAGSLKVLALASSDRFEPFMDAQTLQEQGLDIVSEHWRGMMASNELPDEIVEIWNDVLEKVTADPEFQEFLSSANMYQGYMPSGEFAELVQAQTARVEAGN